MKSKRYILNIQNPCYEKWDGMQPHYRGKFCMQCSKEVVDFTKLDNTQISQIIEQSNGNVCARMTKSQLNQPLIIQSETKRYSIFYKTLAAMFLIGSTGSIFATPLVSKTNSLNVSNNESTYKRIDLKQIKTDSLKNIIKGQVLTEFEGFEEPIPGAEIFIKELNFTIDTDLEGYFSITLPKDFKDNSLTILIKYLGFHDLKTRIYKNDLLSKMNFYLKEDNDLLMGEVVIYKKRWWQFWKRLP